VAFDFRKCRARREAQLLGEDVEDAGETDQRGVFGDCAAGKVGQIKLALGIGRHGRI
jgi:hypothetical protein